MYEPAYEEFEAARPEEQPRRVKFVKAGLLAGAEPTELYFFDAEGERLIVAVSSGALRAWQVAARYLSREEKIDIAGLYLKRRLEAESAPAAESLMLGEEELVECIHMLGIDKGKR
jgi:hypothetical protein